MDAAEFKRLFLPCHTKMYRVAFRLMGDVQTAEDIVQDAYVKLWQKRSELSGVDNIEAYCVTLTKNICYDAIRRERPDENIGSVDDISIATENTMHHIEQRDEARLVKNLIDGLPSHYRQVIVMRDVDGCSIEEIEQATGLSAGNIRVLLSRIRKKIREQFKFTVDDKHK